MDENYIIVPSGELLKRVKLKLPSETKIINTSLFNLNSVQGILKMSSSLLNEVDAGNSISPFKRSKLVDDFSIIKMKKTSWTTLHAMIFP
ncbi:MAG: hypothetical protein ACTSWN_06535 [Promethearchaeota archaeon]